jgi:hypothetical protein
MMVAGEAIGGRVLGVVQLSPVQAEMALLSVRQFVDDPEVMRQFSVWDRMEFDQLEAKLAGLAEGEDKVC